MLSCRVFILLVIALLSSGQSIAATWYHIWGQLGQQDQALYFFDFDTVTRSKGVVTLWLKTLRDPDGGPPPDGIYETTEKLTCVCSKRTIQVGSSMQYDRQQRVIGSQIKPSPPFDAVPGTVGEAILKVVCSANFPKDKSDHRYSAVPRNDVPRYAMLIFELNRATAESSK